MRISLKGFALALLCAVNVSTIEAMQSLGSEENVIKWQQFFTENNWQDLIAGVEPIKSGCGLVHILQSPYKGEDMVVADMRQMPITRPHCHPVGFEEIYFVLQGTATLAIGYDEYSVKAGDVFVIPPLTAHYTVPSNDCVVAAVTPPYTLDKYIGLGEETDTSVKYDHVRYLELTPADREIDLDMQG